MKESEMILAINSDPSAPIFNIADYGIVGDMYEVIPQMIEKIKKQKS
jgi:electron transfer flavoprotein alpha subunit